MTFSTKNMTPISKVAPNTPALQDAPANCLYNPNKFISDADATESLRNDHILEETQQNSGRIISWIVQLIATPVKTSARTPPRNLTVDDAGLEELTRTFGRVTIHDDKAEEKEEAKEEEAVVSEKENITTATATIKEVTKASTTTASAKNEEKEEEEAPKEKLGLYKTKEFTRKSTTKKVTVVRSYRLASDDEE